MLTRRENCWEFKGCGRECDGTRATEKGVCPAASAEVLHGINSGFNGGRACWAIAGTLCGDEVQGSFAMKFGSCLKCDFYRMVVKEEGRDIASARVIHDRLETHGTGGKSR
jgi:hypothetical protein